MTSDIHRNSEVNVKHEMYKDYTREHLIEMLLYREQEWRSEIKAIVKLEAEIEKLKAEIEELKKSQEFQSNTPDHVRWGPHQDNIVYTSLGHGHDAR